MSTYPKNKRGTSARSSRPRKRTFHGNQYSNSESSKCGENEESSSAKKLSYAMSENVTIDPLHSYRIIEFFTVFTALSDILMCRNCKQDVKFAESGIRGLGFKLVVSCRCGSKQIPSGPFRNNGFEINRRIVFVMRLLGVGREGLNLFCNYMDIGTGVCEDTYNSIYNHIHTAAKKVYEFCCKKAVEEEKKENEKHERPILNLKVSGDGSWKKRGFKSLFGATTLIGYYSGKVIDLVVQSSYCNACAMWKNKPKTSPEYLAWQEEHDEENCTKTHEESAGSMEVEAIKMMFARSEELHGVKYGNYIGDGDSKTFSAVVKLNPYGDELTVIKSECIGHVQKRMETRLRNVKKGKKLGGEGKLTEALAKKLGNYYGFAIRRNVDSVENMKKAIMATYNHMISTDDNPKHDNCPAGADSWCKWKQAEALGTEPPAHPNPLHLDVQKEILPIYEDLSRNDLLERCLGGHTQNSNENFNSTVWRLASKHSHSGLKIVEVAAYLAASVFNEGSSSILSVMNELNIIVGNRSFNHAQEIDNRRISRKNRRSSLDSKEARKARKDKLQAENESYEADEGLLYGAGIAN